MGNLADLMNTVASGSPLDDAIQTLKNKYPNGIITGVDDLASLQQLLDAIDADFQKNDHENDGSFYHLDIQLVGDDSTETPSNPDQDPTPDPGDNNQSSISGHDSTIKEGDTWNPADNFDGAKDADGKDIAFDDVTVTGSVDTSKPGEYHVTYTYGDKSVTVTVTVKATDDTTNPGDSGGDNNHGNQPGTGTDDNNNTGSGSDNQGSGNTSNGSTNNGGTNTGSGSNANGGNTTGTGSNETTTGNGNTMNATGTGTSNAQETSANAAQATLPQTGENEANVSVLSVIGLAIASLLGVFGISTKRRKN